MIATLQAVKEKHIGLYDEIKLKPSHKVGGSGILKYKPSGKKITVDTLIELMITRSDNTATNMLTELLGFNYFNRTFKKFGLKVTNLRRKILDLKAAKRGIDNYTTPYEMAFLLEEIYKKRLISRDVCEYMLSILKRQKISDRIPRYLPNYLQIAHKTGLLKRVCHDAGIVFSDKGDILICILTSDISTRLAKKLIGAIAYKVYEEL
jgi:beta-lactamase class A